MRDFTAGPPARLRILPFGAKVLYSAFIVATVIGLLVSARLYDAAIGDAGSAVYYAGAVEAPRAFVPASPTEGSTKRGGGGPVIELTAEDAAPHVMTEEIPARKLLEVTHFHLFSIPVYVLVLAHLWLLAKVPVWAQNGGVVAAVVTSALHIAAPWIVRGRPALAPLMGASGMAMLVTLGVIAVGSMIDMWLPAPKPPAATGGTMAERLAEMRRQRGEQPPG